MSKNLIVLSVFLLVAVNQNLFARDRGPQGPGNGRPGDNRPGDRPGNNWPGNRPVPGRVVYQTLESFRVEKFIEKTNTTRVNLPNVKAIQLTARNNDVEIIEARFELENGREIYMDGLTGGLKENRSVIYTLDGYGTRVRSIIIRGVTKGLTGSRGEIEVSVGLQQ